MFHRPDKKKEPSKTRYTLGEKGLPAFKENPEKNPAGEPDRGYLVVVQVVLAGRRVGELALLGRTGRRDARVVVRRRCVALVR